MVGFPTGGTFFVKAFNEAGVHGVYEASATVEVPSYPVSFVVKTY